MPVPSPRTRTGRARLIAALAGVAVLVPAPPATADGGADLSDVDVAAAMEGFLREHVEGGGSVASAVADTSAAAIAATAAAMDGADDAAENGEVVRPAAATCAATYELDPRDRPYLDGAAYGLGYHCDMGLYVAAVNTYGPWAAWELGGYGVWIDTDGDVGNGCLGGDFGLIAYWDDAVGLAGGVIRTPTCDSGTWTYRGGAVVDRAGESNFVGVAFMAETIGSPSVTRWTQSITHSSLPGIDVLPDAGMVTTALPGAPVPAAATVYGYGPAVDHGSTAGTPLNAPLVGMAPTASGGGYWLLGGDGGVFTFGDAAFHGSTGGMALNRPVVGMGARHPGSGYWLVASDGGIFAFDAPFHGSTGGMDLNRPVVGMAATRSGDGYWLVASDGGIFSFGDAPFSGSTGSLALNQPIVGMAADPDGVGYWFVAADGGVFAFDAPFHGSATGRLRSGDRVVSMAANPTGGYWLTTSTGDVHAFGGAVHHGGATAGAQTFAAIAAHPTNGGYWLLASR